ncbi:MAG: hypothetical protein B7X12_04195, partial [Halothiobacillus sp. 20-53-49]
MGFLQSPTAGFLFNSARMLRRGAWGAWLLSFALLTTACGQNAPSGNVNEQAIAPKRLAAFESHDLLVLRPVNPAISVPAADFMSVDGAIATPALFKDHWT